MMHSRDRPSGWRPAFWGRRGWLACVLWPLSLVYRLLVAVRRFGYARHWRPVTRLPVPVIIIGNLTVGGTGKTPLVIHTVRLLQAAGWRPGVISRGYGGKAEGIAAVLGTTPADLAGDEPVLIARHTGVPLYIGRHRPAVAARLLADNPAVNVLVSDDGLQHLALGRDIEVVVEDARRGAGNGWLLPAGPLREPLARARAVDAVVVNGGGVPVPGKYSMQLCGDTFYNLDNPAITRPAADLAALGPLHAIAGIGSPERFFGHLAGLGLHVIPHPRPDHHAYTREELIGLGGAAILMTEKDAVKCGGFGLPDIWVLPVTAQLDANFDRWLVNKLKESYGSPPD